MPHTGEMFGAPRKCVESISDRLWLLSKPICEWAPARSSSRAPFTPLVATEQVRAPARRASALRREQQLPLEDARERCRVWLPQKPPRPPPSVGASVGSGAPRCAVHARPGSCSSSCSGIARTSTSRRPATDRRSRSTQCRALARGVPWRRPPIIRALPSRAASCRSRPDRRRGEASGRAGACARFRGVFAPCLR